MAAQLSIDFASWVLVPRLHLVVFDLSTWDWWNGIVESMGALNQGGVWNNKWMWLMKRDSLFGLPINIDIYFSYLIRGFLRCDIIVFLFYNNNSF